MSLSTGGYAGLVPSNAAPAPMEPSLLYSSSAETPNAVVTQGGNIHSSSSSNPTTLPDDADNGTSGARKNKFKGTKRRKVNHACVYCRRSHMTCDDSRPCKRCLKREIGHLCHDEKPPHHKSSDSQGTNLSMGSRNAGVGVGIGAGVGAIDMDSTGRGLQQTYSMGGDTTTITPWTTLGNLRMGGAGSGYGFPSDASTANNEFLFLTEFLENLDESSSFGIPQTTSSPLADGGMGLHQPQLQHQQQSHPQQPQNNFRPPSMSIPDVASMNGVSAFPSTFQPSSQAAAAQPQQSVVTVKMDESSMENEKPKENTEPILPSATKKERFLLIAADQGSGSPNERLNRVIQAKYEAGLLKPYNYVKGYARLSKWMDRNVSQDSKQQILQPLSILRPKFRAVAQTLRDIDHVFIEEAFERLLLDYDRVFSAMAIPACLWRRTGEIYKGNREFAELVGVDEYMLRDGRLCIYEVMAEESAVNYWEKYGQIAFDGTQKAVLTSCVLRYKPSISFPSSGHGTPVQHRKTRDTPSSASAKDSMTEDRHGKDGEEEKRWVNCCFSFTIRRDIVGIPSMIVGNFIKC